MVDLLDPVFWLAVGALVTGLVAITVVAWTGWRAMRAVGQRKALERELEDILSREELQRFRHRDFDAFCAKINEVRATKGQQPVEKEFLAKIQYNLMYALDESDF